MSHRNEYNKWREDQVTYMGGKVQREAEAILDKQDAMKRVEVLDHKSHQVREFREDVAAAKVRKGQASYRTLYSSPASQAYRDGWDRIWGDG